MCPWSLRLTYDRRWFDARAGRALRGAGTISAEGSAELSTDALTRGPQAITLEVRNQAGLSAAATVRIGICGWLAPEPFDADLSGTDWRVFGDAHWDPGGFIGFFGSTGYATIFHRFDDLVIFEKRCRVK